MSLEYLWQAALVSCFAYDSTPKKLMLTCSSEHPLTFNGLRGFIFQESKLFTPRSFASKTVFLQLIYVTLQEARHFPIHMETCVTIFKILTIQKLHI
jgi:hypothetical protein